MSAEKRSEEKPKGMWTVKDIPLELTPERIQKYNDAMLEIEMLLKTRFESPRDAYGCLVYIMMAFEETYGFVGGVAAQKGIQ